jgi:hypothetical protein
MGVKDMNKQIESLRIKLETLITEKNNLVDNEVVLVSQELDKLILNYHMNKPLNISKNQTIPYDFNRIRTV